jgi:hypothetical protein
MRRLFAATVFALLTLLYTFWLTSPPPETNEPASSPVLTLAEGGATPLGSFRELANLEPKAHRLLGQFGWSPAVGQPLAVAPGELGLRQRARHGGDLGWLEENVALQEMEKLREGS